MIVAIERTRFTYLYKYNTIRVDINQVIDNPIKTLKWMLENDFKNLVDIFDKAIPLFEQDHEVILIEIDKGKLKFKNGIVLSFDSVIGIYPLTQIGSQLLEGKINDDFIIQSPLFENCIETLRITRSMEFRRITSEKLLTYFNLEDIVSKEISSAIEVAVKKNLLERKQPQEFTTFLDHLIAYNKTPSYIPEGNIEYICKIGAIAIRFLGKQEEVFTNGPFYKSTLKYKSKINNKSYLSSYLDFNSIADNELKSSYEKMVELISKDYAGVDIFKVSYFFLAFKSFINKNDNNIEGLNNEINTLIKQDKNTAAFVLSLLGYTFSFENIYEGIHRLSNAPLLKSIQRKRAVEMEKKAREEAAIVNKKELERKTVEQEKAYVKQDEIEVNIKTEDTEVVSSLSIEKTGQEINSNSPDHIPKQSENISNKPIAKTDEEITSNSAKNISEQTVEPEPIKKLIAEVQPQELDPISNSPIEKTNEGIIPNPIESISEPIVIYEVNEPQTKDDNEKMKDSIAQQEKQAKYIGEDLKEKSPENEILTVQIFRNYLSNKQTKPKQKIWSQFLEYYFPKKNDEITYEKIIKKLDENHEVKSKLLKSEKDKETIKAFFVTHE